MPPQVAGEAVALGPHALVLAQPGRAFLEAALHLHHMGHGVHRPGHARVELQGPAAGLLGLRVEVALLQAEGVQRQHVGEERVRLVPFGQGARRAQAQPGGVSTVEVPQLGPLQRQGVARVLQQQFVPGAAGRGPAAVQHLLHGLQVRAFAQGATAFQRAGLGQVGTGLVHQPRLGQAEQKARLHHMGQGPAGIGRRGGVQIGQRRVVEGHHAPQRALGVVARGAGRRARGVAAQVGRIHVEAVPGGCGQGRGVGRICSQARAMRMTPMSSCRCPTICSPMGWPPEVTPQSMLAAGCSLML